MYTVAHHANAVKSQQAPVHVIVLVVHHGVLLDHGALVETEEARVHRVILLLSTRHILLHHHVAAQTKQTLVVVVGKGGLGLSIEG